MSFAQMRCQDVMIRAGVTELAGLRHRCHRHAGTRHLPDRRSDDPAIHHQIGAKSANDVPHPLDTFVRKLELFDVHSRLGAEFARELRPGSSGAPTAITLPAPISWAAATARIPIGPEP